MSDTTKINFAAFKAGPGGAMAKLLGIDIRDCTTWDSLQSEFELTFDDRSVQPVAENYYGKLSTGEQPVLLAVLMALNCEDIADQLSQNTHGKATAWSKIRRASGPTPHGLAIAACIARID